MIKWILLISVFGACQTTFSAEVVERIVAIINDQVVTLTDLNKFKKQLNENPLVDELLTNGKSIEDLKTDDQVRLDYLINERVLDSLIEKKGLTVTSDKIDQELKKMAAGNNLTRDQLVQALKEQGINLSDYQEFLRTRIERQSLIEQEVSSKIRISDEEVLAAYAKTGQANAQNTYEFTLSHILFLPERGNEEKAKARAEKALLALRNKEISFSKAAKQFSEDPGFSEGGKLGIFRSGEFLPEIETAVNPLEEGGVSGIIKSRAGFHIVRVDKKTLIPNPAFTRVKENIRSRLFEDAFKNYFSTWLADQRSEAFVRIN